MTHYTREELLALGFASVGRDVSVSKDVRFFAISGSLGDNVRIDTYAILTGDIVLAERVHISPFCFLSASGGRITMHADSGVGSHVALLTKSDDYTAAEVNDDNKLSGDITVGQNTIIGSGCKLFPGVTVGANASIGSHCILTTDVKPGDMVVSRGASTITVGNRLET